MQERSVRQAQYIKTTYFNEGEMVFNKGDIGDCMYEIVGGTVGIYLHYKTPEQKLLTVKKGGEYFGEIALLEVRPRTAAAVALEDETILRVVNIKGFKGYVQQRPDVLDSILASMTRRLNEERTRYLDACGVLARFKDDIENGKEIDEELEKDMAECLRMYDRYVRTLEQQEANKEG